MSPGRNGTAAAPPSARRVFHAVEKTETIAIEVERDGKLAVVEFVGYHRDRCRQWVNIEVEAARDAFLAASYADVETTDEATGETMTTRQYRPNDQAEGHYRRDVLLATIAGLQEHEADVLVGSGEWIEILRFLGWWAKTDEAEATTDPEAGGEAEAPTTEPSSPDSAPSTVPTTG